MLQTEGLSLLVSARGVAKKKILNYRENFWGEPTVYFKGVMTSVWKPGHMLCWWRGFAFVSTGEEKLWVLLKLIKIWSEKKTYQEEERWWLIYKVIFYHVLLCVRRTHKSKENCSVFIFTGKFSSEQWKILRMWIPEEERMASKRTIKHAIIHHGINVWITLFCYYIFYFLCFLICFSPDSSD